MAYKIRLKFIQYLPIRSTWDDKNQDRGKRAMRNNNHEVYRLAILEKIQADRNKKQDIQSKIINFHLDQFLNLKKQRPKDADAKHYLSGELKKCYYGNTYRVYSGFFKRFIAKYKTFDVDSIFAWRRDFLTSDKKNSTYNYELVLLKSFSDYLFETGVTPKKLVNTRVHKLKKQTDQENYDVLSDEDTEHLLTSEFDDKVMPYIQFCLLTGLRAAELVGVPDFNYDENRNYLYVVGKGGYKRCLYLNKQLKALRNKMIADKINTTSNLNKRLKRVLKLKNMSRFISFHCFRATFATRLYRGGHKLETISRLLGHRSLDTTTKYIETLRANQPIMAINPYKKEK